MKKLMILTLLIMAGLFVSAQIDNRNQIVRQIAKGDTITSRIYTTYDTWDGTNPILVNYYDSIAFVGSRGLGVGGYTLLYNKLQVNGSQYLGNAVNDTTYLQGRLGINSTGYFSNLAVVGNNSTGATKNMFNFVDGGINKIRTTYAQATDTSSFNFSFTPLGKPLLNILNNAGQTNISCDSLGQWSFGGAVNSPSYNSIMQLWQYNDVNTVFFELKRASLNHGITTIGNTNTVFYMSSGASTTGGTNMAAFSASSSVVPLTITTGNTGSSAVAGLLIRGGKKSGTTLSALSSTEKILEISSWTTSVAAFYGTGDLKFTGINAINIGMLANAATSAGSNLTINAGGNTAGTTADLAGGMLSLLPGQSKGTGIASVRIQRNNRSSTTGTVLNTLQDAIIIPSQNNLSDNVLKQLFEVTLPTDSAAGGHIDFTITATDGDSTQCYTGRVVYAAANFNNTVVTQITEHDAITVDSPAAMSDMTTAWTITSTAGTKIAIEVTANAGFTPARMKIYYTIHNGSMSAVTQL